MVENQLSTMEVINVYRYFLTITFDNLEDSRSNQRYIGLSYLREKPKFCDIISIVYIFFLFRVFLYLYLLFFFFITNFFFIKLLHKKQFIVLILLILEKNFVNKKCITKN